MRKCAVIGLMLFAAIRCEAAAPERGYYTEVKMKTFVRNLERHDWARKERDRIIKRADKWLKYDDARLRTLVVRPEVPRSGITHDKDAPVNGEAHRKSGRYSWKISFDKPWKITSPVDGTVYPSNDFAAFIKSGYKDRSLLTGPYPDDGWGCHVKGFDKPFWFVAFYAQWSVNRLLLPALDDLSRAYLITDDRRYAHAAALLLWQLAEYYPRYCFEKQSRYGKELKPLLGRLLYHTSESLYTCQSVPPAYDAIRPAIENDEALMKFTGQTAAQIRAHIEDRMLRTMAGDIMDGSGRIRGNYGMHQIALLRIAAALRHSPRKPASQEMVAWVLRNPQAKFHSDMGLEDALNNLVHRDGYPFESPSYNCGWIRELNDVAENLGEERHRIVAMPRFHKLFLWGIRMGCAGEFVPSYGDSNHMFHGRLGWQNYATEGGFRHYKDPILARARSQRNIPSKVRDLFAEPIDEEMAEAANRHPEPVGITSRLMAGVGFASLQTGTPANRTALAVFYGFYRGHDHSDRLQLDIYSWRNALTPDFGSPESADSHDPRRFGWLAHTASHNTVMINARQQARRDVMVRGRLHVYDPGRFAQLVEVSAEACYPKVAKLYRRTLMLVDVAPDKAYIVDIFRVRGGTQHDWLVHGTQAAFKSDLPFSEPRKKGTLAGPDVPYGFFYDDKRFGNKGYLSKVPYWKYMGSAFQWLFNVQEAKLDGVGSASWHLNRPEKLWPDRPRKGVVLRAHLVGRNETVFACDGVPQRRKTWPETIKFLIRRRKGEDLESIFVTVFEPYKKTPFITSVKVLPTVEGEDDLPVALEIACGEKKQIVFSRLEKQRDNASVLKLDNNVIIDARAAVLEQTTGGLFAQTYLLDNGGSRGLRLPSSAAPVARATVKSVDYEKGEVTLTRPIVPNTPPAGAVAIVESASHANAIPVAKILSGTTFAVGDDDLSAGLVHVQEVKGRQFRFLPRFVYFIEPGMTVVNESGRVVGRVQSVDEGWITLYKKPPALQDFPDRNQDGRCSCRIVVVGPGDTVTFHASVRTAQSAR